MREIPHQTPGSRQKENPARSGEDNRRSLEGIYGLYVPERPGVTAGGLWEVVYRLEALPPSAVLNGVFEKVFEALSDEPDMEYALIDGTIIKVHRHAVGAKVGSKSGHRQITRRRWSPALRSHQ
jgi:hypothetical protein